MLNPKKQTSYNDGIVYIYSENLNETSFSAKKNVKTLDDLNFITKLFYSEESKRQQDIVFAESMDRKLTLKIKTPLSSKINSNHKAVIGDDLYDIFQLDPDKDNNELYFYLERVRKIER